MYICCFRSGFRLLCHRKDRSWLYSNGRQNTGNTSQWNLHSERWTVSCKAKVSTDLFFFPKDISHGFVGCFEVNMTDCAMFFCFFLVTQRCIIMSQRWHDVLVSNAAILWLLCRNHSTWWSSGLGGSWRPHQPYTHWNGHHQDEVKKMVQNEWNKKKRQNGRNDCVVDVEMSG